MQRALARSLGIGHCAVLAQATFADRHQPTVLQLPGVHRVIYDLPA